MLELNGKIKTLPLFAQKQIIQGMVDGAIK